MQGNGILIDISFTPNESFVIDVYSLCRSTFPWQRLDNMFAEHNFNFHICWKHRNNFMHVNINFNKIFHAATEATFLKKNSRNNRHWWNSSAYSFTHANVCEYCASLGSLICCVIKSLGRAFVFSCRTLIANVSLPTSTRVQQSLGFYFKCRLWWCVFILFVGLYPPMCKREIMKCENVGGFIYTLQAAWNVSKA